ncbi:uncharacterized protein JCM15063_000391 [Sporobolomyces koalae]|uniref:uncharacterized protein n=1 Tax=Sporobolomyces koalae TaxID=500713 RepID=UPI003174F531
MPDSYEARTSSQTVEAGRTQSPSRIESYGEPGRFPAFPTHLFATAADSPPSPVHPQNALPPSGSSIDWTLEYSRERDRIAHLTSLPGLRGVTVRVWDQAKPWLVVVLTGIATGTIASCLDVLSSWLSDLRLGVCRDMWWMSRNLCCAGLDPTETCRAWRTWGEIAGDEQHIVLRALTQYSVYMSLAVLFAVSSSIFVQVFAPNAFHTGIPEIKTLLGGFVMDGFLSPATLLIKSLGLPLAVASGLSLGKEGPLVHVACCIGDLIMRPFTALSGNGARQREILSAAAAAGVSVAFGAPLGGVLFSLEEISTFFPGSTMWQSFVCAITAAVTLQYIDPFNTGKLVLFQVTATQVWRGFELIPWLFLGVLGGIWGAGFIRLNEEWERLRRASGLRNWPVSEVAVLALFTAVVSYLIVFMRIPSAELVNNLFSDCSSADAYGLCDPNSSTPTVALLFVSAFAKTLLTAATFGAALPAGVFLPSLTIGACVGRAVGIVVARIQKANPEAWLFANCPADGACISPPVYAVIGAASALGGVTRMTISLVVILYELTGAIDIVLQLMMAVMVAKFTADYFSKDGIYETWINLRDYPFLNNKSEYRRDTVLVKDVMTRWNELACLTDEGWTLSRLEALLGEQDYRGFPIVRTREDRVLLGYIERVELLDALTQLRHREVDASATTLLYFTNKPRAGRQIHFLPAGASPATDLSHAEAGSLHKSAEPEEPDYEIIEGVDAHPTEESDKQGTTWISLMPWVDEIPVTLSQETPMEIVVQMFQRIGLRFVLLTRHGVLMGMLTKILAFSVESTDSVSAIKSQIAAREGVPAEEQRLIFAGKQLEEGLTLADYDIQKESTIDLTLRLCGGGKKRKKKNYTTPKKIKHKRKPVKMAILKYYRVDSDGKIKRLRRECPAESCGAGVFLANHHNRQYCGKCGLTYMHEAGAN